MPGLQITIYLRKDEVKEIEYFMKELDLKRHQVVKMAIRYFLFPKERESIPVDGKRIRFEEHMFKLPLSDEKTINIRED